MRRTRSLSRPGTLVPLTALCLTGILAFVALALDLGILMLARNQSQNAADGAAMAGARTLTGDPTTNNNYDNVLPNAKASAAANYVLGKAIDPETQLTATIGDYYYDTASSSFQINPDGKQDGNNWTLVQATVNSNRPSFFGKILGMSTLNATATATAAHRPRDAVIVVDFSGSMRFESLLGFTYYGTRTKSMNPDTVYPKWGHYEGNESKLTYSSDQTTSGGEVAGACNVSVGTASAPGSVISGFYADTAAFGTSVPAFTPSPVSYATTPSGDVPLKTSRGSGAGYAKTVSDHVGTTSRDWRFELDGYAAYSSGAANAATSDATDYASVPFSGYTGGPGYWGKTFFAWPPDPRIPLTTTAPLGCSSGPYTATEIRNVVRQFLTDFGYTASGSSQDFKNTSFRTTLAAGITATATTITVSSATPFPAAPFRIMVGSISSGAFTGSPEIMNVTGVSGTTWTVERGRDGTSPVAASAGRYVGLVTAAPLYGVFTAANTATASNEGRTPAGSNLWTSWTDEAALGAYLTANVYKPYGTVTTARKLTTSDEEYRQVLRLFNRNGGPGTPKDGAGNPVPFDWRARFFKTPSGAPLTDTSRLYTSGGSWRVPSGSTYLINYDAILDWIKNSGPNPFPNQLRAGGIVYYTSIPSTINVNTFPPPDPNQRLWKEYIDEVLGVQQTGGSGSSPNYSDRTGYSGYGDDFAWGSASASGEPSGWPTTRYASYSDNPMRPRLRTWFGPLSLVDFLGNYNASDPSNNNSPRLWWPGTVPEAPTYQTKLAIQAALKDALRNHPNDNMSLIFFSSPKNSASATGYYNVARSPLGRNERTLINSLWFSPKVYNTQSEISIYGPSGESTGDIYDVPRANGGTCYAMPLMLAYNQFSGNSELVTYTSNAALGTAGGLGRNGAAKLLVFETDGMVNTGASAPLVPSTNGTGYYRVRVADANNLSAPGTEYPSGVTSVSFSTGSTQSQAVAQQICNNLSSGGYSTSRKPVLIHCIAFGSLFDPSNSSSAKTNALSNLASLEVIGKVQSPGATTLASNKVIVGDFNTRIAKLQAAFSSIMQDGVAVTLVSSGAGKP